MNRFHKKSSFTDIAPFQPVGRISAVVPVLNEQDCIRGCTTSLLNQPGIIEVIVSDGGSSDGTCGIASESGARVVQSRHQGRGFQLFDGILNTSGDVILAIHADCHLKSGATNRMLEVLNTDPFMAGGAFGMAFTSRTRRLKLISFLNNIRACIIGISFGDQGQFCRREALDRIGGFPQQMLMEDIELSLRLKAAGRIAFLPEGILVSPRRWETRPFTSRTVQVISLFTKYLLSRRNGCIQKIADDYYHRYYG